MEDKKKFRKGLRKSKTKARLRPGQKKNPGQVNLQKRNKKAS